ncbi:MAG: hypothetical protein HY718_08330 [Planctomycetes bacterium]|nr:hypothetical protein [Planctomycetota bacterium]
MGERLPGPTCGAKLGSDWIDDGTMCRSRSSPPGPTGANPEASSVTGGPEVAEPPSFLEELRRSAVIGFILGIRRGVAQANAVNPTGVQDVARDEQAAQALLAQGDYERAFEVATGFADYFDIHRQGKATGAPATETAAVMMGHATGFNQATEAVTGETRSGAELKGFDRFTTALDALLRIASTAMTVAGGAGALGSRVRVKVVSPVYSIGSRDIVVVETSVGRQAFYRSTGVNSGHPGQWFPVDELVPAAGGWFNKAAYTQAPGLEKGSPLHRLGTEEFAQISKKLGEMSIPKGQPVPAGTAEVADMTMNRILDFFGARKTPTTFVRPVSE